MVTETLENPRMRALELPAARKITSTELKLPPGTVVVSADSHWDVSTDLFFERLPPGLREKAPRIWKDTIIKFGFPDGKGGVINPFTPEISRISAANSEVAGIHDPKVRVAHLDAEGIEKEINFPQFTLAFCHLPDFELREAVYEVFNEGMAEAQAASNGRSFGVAVLPNWWDASRAKGHIERIKELGFKTFMLPLYPGKTPAGQPIIWSEPEMDPLWDAIEESGLPLCFHIGETSMVSGRGGWGIRVMSTIQPFMPTLSQFIYGGIFDRNPGLRIVFAEGGIGWVPAALQDAEMIYDSYHELHLLKPKLRPSEYWAKHCYATFMNDRIGLETLKYIGADNVMWAVDYPHAEGTFGYSQGAIQDILELTTPDEAKKILGGNAIRVFGL